ncbi:MAG: ATP synthase F0 subunit B [Deltaproteobacteria bacterium]|uniref:ATP synthase subunit b n=1 Tax=Candidatus Zymogenus saltonus TaxID=2844893 RepID=A0A9D8PNS2_9DELT|nr:ATP synthase F0 subunit B [Candidatus Zymogenus saltonus]
MNLKIKLTRSLTVLIIFAVVSISLALYTTLLANGVVSIDAMQNVAFLKKFALSLESDINRFEDFAWRIANFSILIIILHVVLTEKIIDFFSNRKKAIREALDDAAESKINAEKRYQEITAKFSKVKKEVEELRTTFLEEGKRERQRLIETAAKEAEKIRLMAEKSIEHELIMAKQAIKTETVDLALSIAEQILKKNIKKKDISRMTNEYIENTISEKTAKLT